MEKRKSLLLKVALVIVLYSILTHWGDVKRGVIDGLNDDRTTAMNTKAAGK